MPRAKIYPRGTHNPVRRKRVTLTSAEIKAIYTTPKQLLPAVGANEYNLVQQVMAVNNYGAATYAFPAALTFRYTDGSGDEVANVLPEVAFCEATADATYLSEGIDCVPVAGAAVVATVASSNPTTGDGTFTFDILYRVLPIS